MLHHRQPAVIGLLYKLGLVLENVRELNLLILLAIGIHGGPGEGHYAHHHRTALFLSRFPITRDLIVGVSSCRNAFVANLNLVAAAMEHIGLDHLAAIRRRSLELDLKLLFALLEHVFARDQLPFGLVVRQTFADNPRLGQIYVLATIVEKHKML